MKRLKWLYAVTLILFIILAVAANLIRTAEKDRARDLNLTVMNRIFADIEGRVASEDIPVDSAIKKSYDDVIADLTSEYGKENLPERVYFIPISAGNGNVSLINRGGEQDKLWALHKDGEIIGFVVFEKASNADALERTILNVVIALAFVITLAVLIYIGRTVLGPFNKLITYPERLSRNEINEKLPESGNRLFGRFVWGINMLSDRLRNDKTRIDKLNRERQTMLTTIAHGIKTPVANIKLYADAIETGLYQPDGKANEDDAKIARKITANADEVTRLVKELIDTSSEALVEFEPHIESFYLKEIIDILKEEYAGRLELLKIPYEFKLKEDMIIKSDKAGICRILFQLMENAIKYGNGEGIELCIEKDEEGYLFSVSNKGELLNPSELSYVFRSFWRGSNAENIEGSGIGLYEAREIARKLNGDIYVTADELMKFEVYLAS